MHQSRKVNKYLSTYCHNNFIDPMYPCIAVVLWNIGLSAKYTCNRHDNEVRSLWVVYSWMMLQNQMLHQN